MPDWFTNQLIIECDLEQQPKLLSQIGTKKNPLDFYKILPCPKVLEKVSTGGNTIDGKQVKQWIKDDNGKDRSLTEEERSKWLSEYGATNWYDWCIDHWGTKWNAKQTILSQYNNHIMFEFDTAWSPPEPIFQELQNWRGIKRNIYSRGMDEEEACSENPEWNYWFPGVEIKKLWEWFGASK